MKKILLTTDLSEESKEAFPLARKIATLSGATLELLAVVEDPAQAALMFALDFPVLPEREVVEQLKEKIERDLHQLTEDSFPELAVQYSVIDSVSTVHDTIIDFATKNDFDLIVIATHGRTGISRLLIGSVAERVVRESPLPVLTVPSHRS